MLLVTDATGPTGRRVTQTLADQGTTVRAIVRSHACALPLAQSGVELAIGSPADQRLLQRALSHVHTVVLIVRAEEDQPLAFHTVIAAAAATPGVRRVVLLSTAGANGDAPWRMGQWAWDAERQLAASGVAWVAVRPLRYMQHLYDQLGALLSQHVLYGCQGTGRAADVDRRDVADVLAALAVNDVADGTTVDVTGAESLSMFDAAAQLTHHMPRRVQYVNCTPDEYVSAQVAGGVPRWLAEDTAAWQRAVALRGGSEPTDAVERYAQHAPRAFSAFASEFALATRYTAAPAPRRAATRVGATPPPAVPRGRGSAGSSEGASRSRG